MAEILQMQSVELPQSMEFALRELKECQKNNNTESCIMCAHNTNCTQKVSFENLVLQDLAQKQAALQECQQTKSFNSCLKCAELLECPIRNAYVSAAYLSMNKGNGGSFDF